MGGTARKTKDTFKRLPQLQMRVVMYTLIECCRRRGIDPFAYLKDVLTHLPSATSWTIGELTPEAWAAAQKRSVSIAA